VQEFGGAWTDKKLKALRHYLAGYATALKNESFDRIYIDAFAGTGGREIPATSASSAGFLPAEFPDAVGFAEGSARIALSVDPPFSKYVFIEMSTKRCAVLHELRSEFQNRSIEIIRGDANSKVTELCKRESWNRQRGVVFLDPFGMQVDWTTVQAIAKTRALDLWYLIPTGLAIARTMPRAGMPPPAWEARLDRMLGSPSWRDAFYTTDETAQKSLFDDPTSTKLTRTANIDRIEEFVVERLRSEFPWVHPGGLRLGHKNAPYFLLTFAMANRSERAIGLAKRLIAGIFKDQSGGQHGRPVRY